MIRSVVFFGDFELLCFCDRNSKRIDIRHRTLDRALVQERPQPGANMYSIDDEHGTLICAGLQELTAALGAARRHLNANPKQGEVRIYDEAEGWQYVVHQQSPQGDLFDGGGL